jgi:hypothetical protein
MSHAATSPTTVSTSSAVGGRAEKPFGNDTGDFVLVTGLDLPN